MALKLGKATPAAAQSAEDVRKKDLAAKIERMDDVELTIYAQKLGADLSGAKGRGDIVAAVELKEENDAKSAASKKAIEDDEAAQAEAIAAEADSRGPVERAIRQLNAEFCRDVPTDARHGSFETPENHDRFGGSYDVPDGRYRVAGSEWLFDIEDKKLVLAQRANEKNKFGGKNVIAI